MRDGYCCPHLQQTQQRAADTLEDPRGTPRLHGLYAFHHQWYLLSGRIQLCDNPQGSDRTLCAYRVQSLRLQRKAECCKGLEETASDLQGFKINGSRQWGMGLGKAVLAKFLRRILLFRCLTQWQDLPCSWLKLEIYTETTAVKAVVQETH